MWTAEHRKNATRKGLRYPSDLTDVEWRLVEPFILSARHGGRKRHVNVREVLNSIFYVLATGCQWIALPKDLAPKSLAPKSTAHDYFIMLDRSGALRRIHEAL
jgi:transposase